MVLTMSTQFLQIFANLNSEPKPVSLSENDQRKISFFYGIGEPIVHKMQDF